MKVTELLVLATLGWFIISFIGHPAYILDIYCDGTSSTPTFISSLSPNVIVVGDFNIHVDNESSTYTNYFLSCLDSFGIQHFSTHLKGHTLDLVCCSGITPYSCTASDLTFSDHLLVSFKTCLTLFKCNQYRTISFRNIKNIDVVFY